MLPVATILLAAGSSSRLGQPKQLLPFGQSTLLRHAAETALAAALGPVIVVLGALEERCRETLIGLPLTIVDNPTWPEGMGSSIAVGMQAVDETSHRAAIIMLCDQPAITSRVLRSLEEHQRTTGKSIVASQEQQHARSSRALYRGSFSAPPSPARSMRGEITLSKPA